MSEVLIHSFVNAAGEETTQPVSPKGGVCPQSAEELRRIAIDYMYAMAKVRWTASSRIDYTFNNDSLIYEPGQTYLGMIYNNCRNGLENFRNALDGDGVYKLEDIGWDTAPGNSCATSIRHAWQLISPDVEFLYSVDMMPWYDYSHVLPVGGIDWTLYDGNNTAESILPNTHKQVILEAYAQALPADGFMRYLGSKGGHALMVTLPPDVVRKDDGSIDPEESFVYLTDQNNKMNTFREHPSTWKVDRKVSFEKAYTDGWLPVTVRELREGQAPAPVFEVLRRPTADALAAGQMDTAVRCNYCLVTLQMDLRAEGAEGLLAAAELHPYTREVSLASMAGDLHLADLAPGTYRLTVSARVGLGDAVLFEEVFTKS
ncbi:MAG: hypothetical protein E7436_03415 [Ruminococcaceae bacterium]|nr:hypothetical protein [Oscillospiraceae bacterium]